jgi:hypothetical protein
MMLIAPSLAELKRRPATKSRNCHAFRSVERVIGSRWGGAMIRARARARERDI